MEAQKEKIEKESLQKDRQELEEKIKKLNSDSSSKAKDKKIDELLQTITNFKKENDKL